MMTRLTIILLGLCVSLPVLAKDVEGRVDWAQRVVLSTPVSGVVDVLTVQPGMQVKQGDVLLKLEQTNFNAQVRRARADVSKTRYALEEEERQWERAQELYERTVTSTRELKVSEIKYQTARAEHNSARAELSLANKALADSVITAPFDAVVIATHVSPAESVVTRLQQVPMLTLGMTGRYHVTAAVDASTAASLQNGMPVEVEVGGKSLPAEIVFIAVEPGFGGSKLSSAGDGMYMIKAEFVSSELLRIGTQASIIIP